MQIVLCSAATPGAPSPGMGTLLLAGIPKNYSWFPLVLMPQILVNSDLVLGWPLLYMELSWVSLYERANGAVVEMAKYANMSKGFLDAVATDIRDF